jgi:chemotaxis protein MotA
MDLGSVIGFTLTLTFLLMAMALGVGLGPYVDIPSVLIVIGGSIGALLISFRLEQMKNFVKIFMIAIKPQKQDLKGLIAKLIDYATKARKEGILSLEGSVKNDDNEFLRVGLSMAIDGQEPDSIRDMMEIEIEQMSIRHKGNASIFDQWSNLAGAMGMIGTLIGLVAMLLNMSDPSAIGPAMAVALLTTMYGAMIGNIFGAPVANILNIRNDEEVLQNQLILEGIMAIQAGDNPRSMEGKLLSFLPPTERESQFD